MAKPTTRPTSITAAPAMKIGVFAITKAIAAMRAPTSMMITVVQAAGLLPVPAAGWDAETGALLMEISSGSILLTFCHFLAASLAALPGTLQGALPGAPAAWSQVGSSPRESRSQLSISSAGCAGPGAPAVAAASYFVRLFQ